MKLKKSDAWAVAGRAFPEYAGRKFSLEIGSRVCFHDLNWGGGTRNSYRAVELKKGGLEHTMPVLAPWRNPIEGSTVDIPAGWAVVEHIIFQGHDCGLRIHVGASDVELMLPSQQEGLLTFGSWKITR